MRILKFPPNRERTIYSESSVLLFIHVQTNCKWSSPIQLVRWLSFLTLQFVCLLSVTWRLLHGSSFFSGPSVLTPNTIHMLVHHFCLCYSHVPWLSNVKHFHTHIQFHAWSWLIVTLNQRPGRCANHHQIILSLVNQTNRSTLYDINQHGRLLFITEGNKYKAAYVLWCCWSSKFELVCMLCTKRTWLSKLALECCFTGVFFMCATVGTKSIY